MVVIDTQLIVNSFACGFAISIPEGITQITKSWRNNKYCAAFITNLNYFN